MPRRPLSVIATFFFFAICLYSALRTSRHEIQLVLKQNARPSSGQRTPKHAAPPRHEQQPTTAIAGTTAEAETAYDDGKETSAWEDAPAVAGGPKPVAVPDPEQHPVRYLIAGAKRQLAEMTQRQSGSLKDAVHEYRRRYGIPPPPHFDKWFQFAKDNKVVLVDEFDTVHALMTPFWGLKPSTIRLRAREALGYDNSLIGIAIRDRDVSHMEGGTEWQRNATYGMLRKFLPHLPDMDLAFNIHDEPRVMVPHDDLTRLVHKAKHVNMPASNATKKPINDFSSASPELSRKMVFEQVKRTRFNSFGRQATWTHSRMSCPPSSPARILEEDERWDDLSQYGMGELGFVYNVTAMSDICLTPSLGSAHGFFDRPNVYKVVHDLFPVFSQSKVSSYNDIVYPSPWYWYDKVKYRKEEDVSWSEKESKLYWRGSTTGGFSRHGGWRRQHRQQLVKKINAGGQAKIMTMTMTMTNQGRDAKPGWGVVTVPRAQLDTLVDVSFSHVGQCDPGDCKAQQAFFNVTDRAGQADAWKHKYLLDMDGNAFSGRFLAFLQSMSQTFKFALFREWHNEWVKPWAHYVPLSLQGDDWLEALHFFSRSDLGAADAETMAAESRDWAGRALRKEDMEAWFFRLLLE
ncbi:hypothetical protein UVI_02046950 [Ustilaginoidea virens]|nr:hypothetical protein UVI_02046950 [Ustilaginoidea virens]